MKLRLFALVLLLASFDAVGANEVAPTSPQADNVEARAKVSIDDLENIFGDTCFACHGYGESEGGFQFENLTDSNAHPSSDRSQIETWEAVWKNIQSQTMPPAESNQPDPEQRKDWTNWINKNVFRLDPNNVDPGKVVLRRLNRNEYRAAIADLIAVDYKTDEEFPADDTGYGFDTIGEVLNLSPVLMEKYLSASQQIVDQAIPVEGPTPPQTRYYMDHFKKGSPEGPKYKDFQFGDGGETHAYHISKKLDHAGTYRVEVDWQLDNAWTKTPQAATLELRSHQGPDGNQTKTIDQAKLGFLDQTKGKLIGEIESTDKPVHLSLHFKTLSDDATTELADHEGKVHYRFHLDHVDFIGPLDGSVVEYSSGERVLIGGPPPRDADEKTLDKMTRDVIWNFASNAYRRPIDDKTLDRLVSIAASVRSQEGKRYEDGIAMVSKLILASPRFLFRIEDRLPDGQMDQFPADFPTTSLGRPIDQHAFASRLSFFVWGTPPDGRLRELARQGKLYQQLDKELVRIIAEDWRMEIGVKAFVGQWLQTRDVMDKQLDERRILAYRDPDFNLNWRVRDGMKKETERMFQHLIQDDRPAYELLNADYTFVNEHLADFYGIQDKLDHSIDGYKMQKVDLPKDSNRKGLLTNASFLLVTSNPTRTSPVKRGLFILENLLGAPAPPAPPNVPDLEESKKGELKNASLREVLESHRSKAECASCHARMDPLGLALEHYNAMGQYREKELGLRKWRGRPATPDQDIDPSGQLMTGEKFGSVVELADILANERRDDFYRCLTEKMMTYALGRGLTYRDTLTVDSIVKDLHEHNGSMQQLIRSIVRSVPFTHMRNPSDAVE